MADAHQQYKPATGYPAAQPSYPNGPTATAYPYPQPAPAPAPYYPNPYPPFNPRRSTFLRRAIAAAIAVLIIIGAVSFILWLVLRPRLPQFSVTSVSVTSFNLSSSSLTANWDVVLSVRNPNKKMTVEYGSAEAAVTYDSKTLASTTLSPFSQGKRNQTTVSARLAAAGSYVGEGTASQLTADRARGSVVFRVKLFAWVRFRSGAWRTRSHFMRVWCRHVPVALSSAQSQGSLSGAPRECEVDL